jgi:hypothetical protein
VKIALELRLFYDQISGILDTQVAPAVRESALRALLAIQRSLPDIADLFLTAAGTTLGDLKMSLKYV